MPARATRQTESSSKGRSSRTNNAVHKKSVKDSRSRSAASEHKHSNKKHKHTTRRRQSKSQMKERAVDTTMIGELAVLYGQLVQLDEYDKDSDTWYVTLVAPWALPRPSSGPASALRKLTRSELAAIHMSNNEHNIHEDVPLLSAASLSRYGLAAAQQPSIKINPMHPPFPVVLEIERAKVAESDSE